MIWFRNISIMKIFKYSIKLYGKQCLHSFGDHPPLYYTHAWFKKFVSNEVCVTAKGTKYTCVHASLSYIKQYYDNVCKVKWIPSLSNISFSVFVLFVVSVVVVVAHPARTHSAHISYSNIMRKCACAACSHMNLLIYTYAREKYIGRFIMHAGRRHDVKIPEQAAHRAAAPPRISKPYRESFFVESICAQFLYDFFACNNAK